MAQTSRKTKVLKLYLDFLSQPSRALFILLKISGKQFKTCEIDLLAGEHLTDEYKQQVNRFQKVPAIIDEAEADDNFRLAESIAILRYLCHKAYIANYLYPLEDIKELARIDEFLQWQHNGIRSSCSLYFRFIWVQTRLFGAPAAEGKVLKYANDMENDLRLLETIWLRDTQFLTGDNLNAADIFGACEVEQLKITGYDVGEKFPKVANWLDAVRAKLHPYFGDAHHKVYAFAHETKAKL